MTPRELVEDRLRAHGCKRGLKTPNGYMWQCPAHEDNDPSLHVSEGSDGRALLKCHAGCSTDGAVCPVLGIEPRDLFPDDCRRDSFRSGNGGSDRASQPPAPAPPDVTEWTASSEPAAGELRQALHHAALGDYTDANAIRDRRGRLWGYHPRYDPPGKPKAFAYWRNGHFGLDGLPTTTAPLYLSELVDGYDRAQPLVLVEGEKCAEELHRIGVQALATICGSSTTPGRAVLEVLDGFPVVLCPDLDDHRGGERHMGSCGSRSPGAATLRLLMVAQPGSRRSGYDIANWIEELRCLPWWARCRRLGP